MAARKENSSVVWLAFVKAEKKVAMWPPLLVTLLDHTRAVQRNCPWAQSWEQLWAQLRAGELELTKRAHLLVALKKRCLGVRMVNLMAAKMGLLFVVPMARRMVVQRDDSSAWWWGAPLDLKSAENWVV